MVRVGQPVGFIPTVTDAGCPWEVPPEGRVARREAGRMVREVARRLPCRALALPRATTARWMLRRRGIRSHPILGGRRGGDPAVALAYHAWAGDVTEATAATGPCHPGSTVFLTRYPRDAAMCHSPRFRLREFPRSIHGQRNHSRRYRPIAGTVVRSPRAVTGSCSQVARLGTVNPDYNPIELAFSKLTSLRRKAVERTSKTLVVVPAPSRRALQLPPILSEGGRGSAARRRLRFGWSSVHDG